MSEATKEQINRRLAEFDGRCSWDEEDKCWYIGFRPYYSTPDYCSSASPRSLLEGIEAQLSEDQQDRYLDEWDWYNFPIDLLVATAEQKAKAIHGILEKE